MVLDFAVKDSLDLLSKLSKTASENLLPHGVVDCDGYRIGLFGMNTLLECNKFPTTWESQKEQEHEILIIHLFLQGQLKFEPLLVNFCSWQLSEQVSHCRENQLWHLNSRSWWQGNDRELGFQSRTLDCCPCCKQPQHATQRPLGDHPLLLPWSSFIWFDNFVNNLKTRKFHSLAHVPGATIPCITPSAARNEKSQPHNTAREEIREK